MNPPRENLKRDVLQWVIDPETDERYMHPSGATAAFFKYFNEEFNGEEEVRKYPYFTERVAEYLESKPKCIRDHPDTYTIVHEMMPSYGYRGGECTVDNFFHEAAEALVEAYLTGHFQEEEPRQEIHTARWLCYYKSKARAMANNCVLEFDGHFDTQTGQLDSDDWRIDTDTEFSENVRTWCGSVPAFVILDRRGQILAKYGWWQDDEQWEKDDQWEK